MLLTPEEAIETYTGLCSQYKQRVVNSSHIGGTQDKNHIVN